jgi:pimeloyl-ACP methyl ester carboxylesterase
MKFRPVRAAVVLIGTSLLLLVLVAIDGRAQLITGRAPVGNRGHELYYEVQGTGEPVVLIHGLTLDLREWDAQVEALADKYQVIRYDRVGHGKSSGLSASLPDGSVRDWEYLRELLDELDVDKAHVVGLSMGGSVAIDFALQHPDRVQTLTPIDSVLGGYTFSNEFGNRYNSYLNVSRTQGVQAALPLWAADPMFAPANANPEVRTKLEQIVVQGHGALGVGAMFQWPNMLKVAGLSAMSRLKEIDHPTLVMVGELDLADFQGQSNILDRNISNSTKLVVPGAGHMSDMENPEFVNSALLDFFAAHPITLSVPGDFSGDGIVDAADYVVWRKGLGTDYTHNDYDLWRAHFGEIGGGGSALPSAEPLSAAVPEPATLTLLVATIVVYYARRCSSLS